MQKHHLCKEKSYVGRDEHRPGCLDREGRGGLRDWRDQTLHYGLAPHSYRMYHIHTHVPPQFGREFYYTCNVLYMNNENVYVHFGDSQELNYDVFTLHTILRYTTT